MSDIRVKREVYRFVLYATTNSFAENITVKYDGVILTSIDGDVIEIKGRTHKSLVEQIGGGKVRITIDVVNEDKVDLNDVQTILKRIDCMLDEEYTPNVLATVVNSATHASIPWELELDECYQTVTEMDMDMSDDVKNTITYLTSAMDFSDEFTASLVKELDSGKYSHVLDFINTLAEL